MTSGAHGGGSGSRRVAVPRLPQASAAAGTLPPGSAPAVGWRAPATSRLPDRPQRSRREEKLLPPPPEAVTDVPAGEVELPVHRPPLLVQGALPAVLAVLLALAATAGRIPFAVALLVVQLVVAQSVLALVEAPSEGGASAVAALALVAADVAVLADDGDVRGFAGVVALALIASLLHQLLRRNRSRVTESMADTLVAVTLAVSVACLLALRALDGGDDTVRIALVAAAASLLAGRIGDRIAPRPMLAVGSTRGWPGLLLGLGAGVAAAVVVAGRSHVLVGDQAALLGLVCAATVAAADLAVDLGAAELRAGEQDARRTAALLPSNAVLPIALLGPIALVAGHLVLG